MTKKILGVIVAVILMFATSYVFAANNEMGDSLHKASNTVRNVVGGAENAVGNAASTIGTGVKDLGNTFTDGAARVTNNGTNQVNNGYNATRTATTRAATTGGDTFLGMSANVWTWFVLAIAAIAIVGLVWYYAMQNNNEYNNNNNNH